MDVLKQPPAVIQAAIAQAEAEVKARADRCDELSRVVEPTSVGGKPALPLSYARRLIMSKVTAGLGADFPPSETVTIVVFVLFGPSLAELSTLANKPQEFRQRAWDFAMTSPEDCYDAWAEYARRKLDHLQAAVEMSGTDAGAQEAGPGKNVLS